MRYVPLCATPDWRRLPTWRHDGHRRRHCHGSPARPPMSPVCPLRHAQVARVYLPRQRASLMRRSECAITVCSSREAAGRLLPFVVVTILPRRPTALYTEFKREAERPEVLSASHLQRAAEEKRLPVQGYAHEPSQESSPPSLRRGQAVPRFFMVFCMPASEEQQRVFPEGNVCVWCVVWGNVCVWCGV